MNGIFKHIAILISLPHSKGDSEQLADMSGFSSGGCQRASLCLLQVAKCLLALVHVD